MSRFRLSRVQSPDWAPRPHSEINGLTDAEYTAIQSHRDELLDVVHQEVDDYLNTTGLYSEGEGFPDRLRMTGTYYIGSESYLAHRDPTWFQISVMCRCLERPKDRSLREDDYLGLEVWLKCVPGRWSSFEVFRNTDSSSI